MKITLTEKEHADIEELDGIISRQTAESIKAEEEGRDADADAALKLLDQCREQRRRILYYATERQLKQLSQNPEDILPVVKETIQDLSKTAFQAHIKIGYSFYRKKQVKLKAEIDAGKYDGSAEEKENALKAYKRNEAFIKENVSYNSYSAFHYLAFNADIPLQAAIIYDHLNEGADIYGKCFAYIEGVVAEWYKLPKAGLRNYKWQRVDLFSLTPDQYKTALQASRKLQEEEKAQGSKAMAQLQPQNNQPTYTTILPKTQAIAHDLINNLFFSAEGIPNKEVTSVTVSNKKAPVKLETQVFVDYGDTPADITEYSLCIDNAVNTLWEYGNPEHIFDDRTIYRQLTHKTGTVPQAAAEEIHRHMMAFNNIHFKIDGTEEAIARGYVDPDTGKPLTTLARNNRLYEFTTIERGTEDGKIYEYHFYDIPIKYYYAKVTNKVWNVPSDLLNIKELREKDGVLALGDADAKRSKSRSAALNFILRQILRMKSNPGSKKQNKYIRINGYRKRGVDHDGICQAAGYDNPSKVEVQRIREYSALVLENFRLKGFIKGYSFRKEGHEITSILIDL